MAIPITCPACHTRMRADDKLAGKNANCGQCGAQIYIEPPGLASDSTPARSSSSDYHLAPPEDRLPTTGSSNRGIEQETPCVESNSCSKCGTPLASGQEHCQSCYYHSGLKRVVDIRDDDEREGGGPAYGFRRHLQDKLTKGQSPESVFYLLDCFFSLLILAITVWLSISFYIGLVLVAIYIAYRVAAQGTGQSHRGNSCLWLTVLFAGRALEWKTFSGRARKAARHRGPTFDDTALEGISELSELQVLDLSGTAITDAGLATLKHHGHLEFLIVRGTKVTPDGVWALQETIPTTCIWY